MKRVSANTEGRPVKRRREAGQTLAFVTFGLVAFLTAAGLAVDMGYLRYERRLMQAAADSAALAAATDLNLGNASIYFADALDAAQFNGFTDGVNNVTVTPSNPPATLPVGDPNSGNTNAVEVVVQQILPSLFMKIVGLSSTTMQATAVAAIGTSNGCMYALQARGITLNAGVDAANCGIVDNGSLSGNGNLTAASVGVFGSAAGYTAVSSPPAETIVQPAADPLAYLAPPTVGGCTQTNFTWSVGITALAPGVYCGGIAISGGSVTFGPGLYILTGTTGLQITGAGIATDAGAGVTFYNSGTGGITFSGTGSVSFTAPTSAVSSLPAGILFYQDPADTTPADLSLAGTGNAVLSGTLYFPAAPLTVAGSLNPSMNTVVVAGSITVSGSVLLKADSISVPGGSPLQTVSLVE